jgi:hypothetical protein
LSPALYIERHALMLLSQIWCDSKYGSLKYSGSNGIVALIC